MPDLRLREVHLPELHLPEMSREDIIRAIGDATRDVDLGRFDPRGAGVPEIEPSPIERAKAQLAKVDLSRVDLSRVDLPKAIATAGQAVGLVRAPRRSRLPFVIGGLLTLGLVGFALLTSTMVRPRLDELGRKARARIDAMREPGSEDVDAPDFESPDVEAVAVAIEPAAFLEVEPETAPVETEVEAAAH